VSGELLLLVSTLAGSASLLALRHRDARPSLVISGAGLLAATMLALGLPAAEPASRSATQLVTESAYLRTAGGAFAGSSVLAVVSSLLAGIDRRQVARVAGGSLVALAAATVALGSREPVVSGLGALLGALAALVASGAAGVHRIGAASRELRVSVVAAAAVALGAGIAPALATTSAVASGAGAATPDGLAPAVGAAVLGVALGAALRFGAIPLHLWTARAADVVPAAALPLALGWAPVLLAAAALHALDVGLMPLGAPVDGERAVITLVAVLTLLLAPIAAWIQDDLGHAITYTAIAAGGVPLLGIAALDPDAWRPTRTWLVVVALAVTALGAWLAGVEARHGTRRLPELDGWARRSPVAGIALAVAGATLVGLPGWPAFDDRRVLAELALGSPIGSILGITSLAVVLPLARILVVGLRRPSSRVAGAAGEGDGLGATRTAWSTMRRLAGGRSGGRGALARAAAGAAAASVVANRAPLASLMLVLLALAGLAVAMGGLELVAASGVRLPASRIAPAG